MMSSTDRPVGFPIRAPRCLQPTYTRASMNRGQLETAKLRQNAEEQVARLMTQLEDLDAMRDVRGWRPCACTQTSAGRAGPDTPERTARNTQDLEEEEYESTRAETLKQLEEFNASLSRMMVRARLCVCCV